MHNLTSFQQTFLRKIPAGAGFVRSRKGTTLVWRGRPFALRGRGGQPGYDLPASRLHPLRIVFIFCTRVSIQ